MRDDIETMVEKLKTERDELRVKAHLLRAELRDEWQEIEDRFEHFRSKSRRVLETSGEAGEEVLDSLRAVGKEVADGYRKIRDSM